MTDKIKPQKILLSDDVLESIKFERRIIGQAPDGPLISIPTPPHMNDWVIRDSSMDGFLARVTRGGIRFYTQRKLGGRPQGTGSAVIRKSLALRSRGMETVAGG